MDRALVLAFLWLGFAVVTLAIPHYLIVGFFLSGSYVADEVGGTDYHSGGLAGLVVFFAGIALLFTGTYPKGLFDLVLGTNRWCHRCAPPTTPRRLRISASTTQSARVIERSGGRRQGVHCGQGKPR
ncbi:hypothetical protein ACFOWZ_27230 [Lentzea rhizosphaerae]|uniref:Uncharacterized protein n=1 Tax=Lentzea rhizosphaerae TaxID=2041025 RepID=A0ABV8BZN4_9PSEU